MMFPTWMAIRKTKFREHLLQTQRDIVVGNFLGATYRQEEIVDSEVRSILREVRIKNYLRNVLWIVKWLCRCAKYVAGPLVKKVLAWHRKMYYKWGAETGVANDSGLSEGEHGGSS